MGDNDHGGHIKRFLINVRDIGNGQIFLNYLTYMSIKRSIENKTENLKANIIKIIRNL